MRPVDPETGPFAAGDTFLKYEVKGFLGRGGHAFVYHGYDPFLDRHVAIKIILSPADPGRDLSKRAQLEARVLVRLQHPNVVRVIDAGVAGEGYVYIIMELLEGRTLREVLADVRTLSVAEALTIGASIADGVAAAHAQNVIHRDLKPENVFVQPANAAKVLDFGIAKFLGYDALTTQKDLIHGTMLYVSPEHLQGLGATPRSDVFALGTILYEALAGIPPSLIGVEEPTMNALAWAQINRVPKPLDETVKDVPSHVARAIQRMIAKDPADRFASMAEVATVLRQSSARLLGERGGPVVRDLWVRAPAVPAGSDVRGSARTKIGHSSPDELLERPSRPAPSVPAPASARRPSPVVVASRAHADSDAGNSHTAPGVATVHRPSWPPPSRKSKTSPVALVLATAVGLGVAGGLAGGLLRLGGGGAAVSASAAAASAPLVVSANMPAPLAPTSPPSPPPTTSPSAVAEPAAAPSVPAVTGTSRVPEPIARSTLARPSSRLSEAKAHVTPPDRRSAAVPASPAAPPSAPPAHPPSAPKPAFGADDI